MKRLYLFFSLAISIALNAQVANRMEVTCSGQSASIHNVLGSGKALIITSQGLDCSICASKASAWGSWASSNKAQVAVWGAMTYTYSSNVPSCTNVNDWVGNHAWNDIFTFIDSSEYYFESGTPRYLVYDPSDSSLIYTGASESQARTMALNASQINLSIQQFRLNDVDFIQQRGQLNFQNVPLGNTKVEVYNLTGKKEKSFILNSNHKVLSISDLPKGIYLIRMSNTNSALTRKIVIS